MFFPFYLIVSSVVRLWHFHLHRISTWTQMYRYNYTPYDVRLSRNINYLRTITSLNWLQQIIYHVLDDCSMRAKFRSCLVSFGLSGVQISTWGLYWQLLLWAGSYCSYGTPDSDDHYNLHGIRSCPVASLLCSFTQILWQLPRAKPLKISTIDSLFSVVSNPFRLTYSDVFLRAPVL